MLLDINFSDVAEIETTTNRYENEETGIDEIDITLWIELKGEPGGIQVTFNVIECEIIDYYCMEPMSETFYDLNDDFVNELIKRYGIDEYI
jgi:hypothetical protein